MGNFPYGSPQQQKPDLAESLLKVDALAQQGRADAALGAMRQLLKAYPRELVLYEHLANLFRGLGRAEEAIAPLRMLTELDAKNHLRFTALGSLYHELNDLPNAERNARQALALNPLNAQAHNLLGMIYLSLQHNDEAEFHFRQLLLLHEPLAPITANLANAYKGMGRLDDAETYFRYCTELDPNNIEGWLSWTRLAEARKEMPRAWELLKTAESIRPDYPGLAITRSVLHRREKRYEQALAELDSITAHTVLNSATLHFERGQVLDGLKRYQEAFTSFEKANRLYLATGRGKYNEQAHVLQFEKLRDFYQPEQVQRIRDNLADAYQLQSLASPVFIVGFPRSGTTMTEQILASHPNIAAGDELDYVHRLTTLASHMTGSKEPYPACLAELTKPEKAGFINKFRGYYTINAELRKVIEPGKGKFTDKMPLNEVHLGLIHLVFPQAPIVHLLRHPLDVVLSTFFNDLTHGGYCSYQLETAATHYARVFELVQHYRSELDLHYLAVRYEDLIEDPEPEVRRLLEFVGEPFDERCLAFHENARLARTASYAQVTEKLYTRSRYRYKNYLQQLEPIIPLLQPAIDQLGYEV